MLVELIEGLADVFAGVAEVGSKTRRHEAIQAAQMPAWMEEQAAREDNVARASRTSQVTRDQGARMPGAEERSPR